MERIELTPGGVNVIAYKRDDYTQRITVQDEAGVGYALSDAKMQVKDLGGTAVVSLTVGSGIEITNPGVIVVTISKTTLANIAASDYSYDIEVTLTSTGRARTVVSGTFSVVQDITV